MAIGCVALGMLCSSALQAQADGQPASPRLEVDETEVNLGILVRGQFAEGSFALRNGGNAPLRILRADPG